MGSSSSKARSRTAGSSGALLEAVAAHKHSVTCMRLCGEQGDVLVTASEDRTLRIWDMSKKQKLARYWETHELLDKLPLPPAKADRAHDAFVPAMRCPRKGDGAHGHAHWISCMAVDMASSVLYSGSLDKTVKAWDMYSGRCMHTYTGHTDWITSLHIRLDTLVSSSEDGSLRLWKIATFLENGEDGEGKEGKEDLKGCWRGDGDFAIKSMLSVSDDCFFCADSDGCVSYWDLSRGAEKHKSLLAELPTSVGSATCLAAPFHEQEREEIRRLDVNIFDRQSARVSRLRTRQSGGSRGGRSERPRACMSVIVGGSLGAESWEFWGGGSARLCAFNGHQGAITCMQVVDGTLFTGSEDKTVRAWSLDSGLCLQLYQGHLHPLRELTVLPGGRFLCSGSGGDLRVWDVETGEVKQVLAWKRVDCLLAANSLGSLFASFSGLVRSWETSAFTLEKPGKSVSRVIRPRIVLEHVACDSSSKGESSVLEAKENGNGERGKEAETWRGSGSLQS
uniref:Guanine nucleotide-binding protein subunit beta-like protein n=1 Tax=Hanusia phi TaxID=3032 RepID=A0A7S0EU85_9CRYP|mmetsp:Transcript_31489/g.70845  ORF Transcript_31489/g.70845 Transcript_31489/m.70845 type:complete len:507 (+) Transcript_31489:351-1871(+)